MYYLNRFFILIVALLLAGGCSEQESSPAADAPEPVATAPKATPSEAPVMSDGMEAPEVSDADLADAIAKIDAEGVAERIEVLASDEFGGRAPFTDGETKTLEYLEAEFKALGVEPGNGDSYRQAVNLVEITADPSASLMFYNDNGEWTPEYGTEMVIGTKRVKPMVELDSEVVFVGYGIVAPEYEWNDYEGVDVEGKTVIILVNDPGFATQDENVFKGNAMTYYGRWTYKYEEAARQGAGAALIVHQTDAAGYPWEVVGNGWSGPQFDLAAENDNMHRAAIEGWLSNDMASALFAEAGQDFDALAEKAATPEFEPMAIDLKAKAKVENTIRRSQSYNVIGKITGSVTPEEYFIYTAHWDHLGTSTGEGHDLIYNGAVDNATGTAALLEMAEAFKALPQAPARSILFLAVTAEESGLLGSAHYGTNPIYPLEDTVGGINIDAMNVSGRTKDVVVVGYGSSELEDILKTEAAAQDREIVPEPTPEKGYFYRSDHFNFAKKGVPVLYAEGGVVHREKGREYGMEAQADYVANRYHKPSDEYDPETWDLSGAVEDMELYFRIGLNVANSDQWPNWYEGTEFRSIRDADRP